MKKSLRQSTFETKFVAGMAMAQTLKTVALFSAIIIIIEWNETDLCEFRLLWQPESRRFVFKSKILFERSLGRQRALFVPRLVEVIVEVG